MLDQTSALVLLVIVLACAVVASAALARPSLAPLRHTEGEAVLGSADARLAMRRAGARAAVALAASGVTVAAFVWASAVHPPMLDSVLVFIAPPLTATVALVTSALLPARLLPSGRRSSAALTPRRAWASAPRS